MKAINAATLVVLLFLCASAAAQTIEVIGPFIGRSVKVPVPADYCRLPRASALGKAWYRQLEETNAQLSVIGTVFVDCEDLREKERDMNFIATRYAIVTVVAPGGDIKPVKMTRRNYIREMAASEPPNEDEFAQTVADAFAKLSSPSAGRGAGMLLGLMGVDDNAAYFGQASIAFYPSGPVRMDTLTVSTLVNQLPIAIHVHRKDEGDETFKALLKQGKRLAANIARANRR